MCRVPGEIRKEMNQATKEHGMLTRDPVRASTILSEECGEVSRASLTMTRPGGGTKENREQLRREITQVAALAALWLLNMENEDDQFKEGNLDLSK